MPAVRDKIRSNGNGHRVKYRRLEVLLPLTLSEQIDNYRASKRPIPSEAEIIRWMITEQLIVEGFAPAGEV